MRYDIGFIEELCLELGFPTSRSPRTKRLAERLDLRLGNDIVLCFENAELDQDCLIGFAGTPWHAHGDLEFADKHGNSVTVNYVDMLSGLADGQILICERWSRNNLSDRWLIHRDCNDETRYLNENDEMRVFRAKKLAQPLLRLVKDG
jgi:hypothetical protein